MIEIPECKVSTEAEVCGKIQKDVEWYLSQIKDKLYPFPRLDIQDQYLCSFDYKRPLASIYSQYAMPIAQFIKTKLECRGWRIEIEDDKREWYGVRLYAIHPHYKEPKPSFEQHLANASKVVSGWPKWKQKLLGGRV